MNSNGVWNLGIESDGLEGNLEWVDCTAAGKPLCDSNGVACTLSNHCSLEPSLGGFNFLDRSRHVDPHDALHDSVSDAWTSGHVVDQNLQDGRWKLF